MLYVDVPTLSEFKSLHAHREEACVSIYLETTPLSQQWEASRIALGNLMKTAAAQLAEKGIDKNVIAGMTEKIESLQEDFEWPLYQGGALGMPTDAVKLIPGRDGRSTSSLEFGAKRELECALIDPILISQTLPPGLEAVARSGLA